MTFSLIPTAMAATGSEANPSAAFMQIIFFIVIFGLFFYFMLYRPQAKRAAEQKALLSSLAVGDEVVTIGGIVGIINKLTDEFVVITVSDGVNITLQKPSIVATLPKGTLKAV